MQPDARQGHLLVEGIKQRLLLDAAQAPAQQLAALAQKAPVAAQQGCVERFQLQHHPVEPLAPQRGLAPHQLQIQGTESHTAQRSDQIQLPLQDLAVAQDLATPLATQLQFQVVVFFGEGADATGGLALLDQVAVAGAAVRAQAREQLHAFQQVGFALPVGADHQHSRCRQLQVKPLDVAEVLKLQSVQPDGSGAVSG
jgi:hypothetical protein